MAILTEGGIFHAFVNFIARKAIAAETIVAYALKKLIKNNFTRRKLIEERFIRFKTVRAAGINEIESEEKI